MEVEKQIRKLAKSNYWMNIYRASKEVNLSLFENKTNFSGLQSLFLFWLGVYDSLYTDLSQKEYKYIDEDVIENDVRTDAYLYWRNQQREAELNKYKQEQKKNNLNFKTPGKTTSFDIDFN